MRSKDVCIGEKYETKVSGTTVLVRVVSEAPAAFDHGTGKRGPARWNVRRVDNGERLPKPRTAAALHRVPA